MMIIVMITSSPQQQRRLWAPGRGEGFSGFPPGLNIKKYCLGVQLCSYKTLPKALRTQVSTALTRQQFDLTAVTAVASFASCYKLLAAKPQFHFNIIIA